jgi:ornithine--oxo-acid transaminase
LIGVVLKPELGGARQYAMQLMALGLLCRETHEHVIRFAPPLVISREEIDWLLERVAQVFQVDAVGENA